MDLGNEVLGELKGYLSLFTAVGDVVVGIRFRGVQSEPSQLLSMMAYNGFKDINVNRPVNCKFLQGWESLEEGDSIVTVVRSLMVRVIAIQVDVESSQLGEGIVLSQPLHRLACEPSRVCFPASPKLEVLQAIEIRMSGPFLHQGRRSEV